MSEIRDTNGFTPLPELPAAPPSKVFGQGYSANHPIPTVQSYKATHAEHEAQAAEYASIVEKRRQEAEERQRRVEEEARQRQNAPVDELEPEKNVVKNQADKKSNPVPNTGANEKARLMDQMNANQSELARFQRGRRQC